MVSLNSRVPVVRVAIEHENDENSSSEESEVIDESDAVKEVTSSDQGTSEDELNLKHKASDDSSDNTDVDNIDEVVAMETNEGWADSLAKILKTNKPKNKKSLVLSRAKKLNEVKKVTKDGQQLSFEIDGTMKKEKIEKEGQAEVKTEHTENKRKRKIYESKTIRCKPEVLQKDRERTLSKIATRGVVQLFNAVRNQQKNLEQQIEEVGHSETKREKIMKSFDKRSFLDVLMGQTQSTIVDKACKKELKSDVKNEDFKPKWNALRDDFMTGAKMKDWDKDIESDS